MTLAQARRPEWTGRFHPSPRDLPTLQGGHVDVWLRCELRNLAGPSAAGLTNATAIGQEAMVSRSNSLVMGGTGVTAVNVGNCGYIRLSSEDPVAVNCTICLSDSLVRGQLLIV